jgi:hypothetical protein
VTPSPHQTLHLFFSKQDETHEKEEEEQTDKEQQTSEEEVARQDGSGSSN